MDFANEVKTFNKGETSLFSVGQAGFIIKSSSGQLLGIDLYLSECVERIEGNDGFKRLLPFILNPKDLQFDVLIATHPHLDHFDEDAMPFLMDNNKTTLFLSVDCEKIVKKIGLQNKKIKYVVPGDVYQIGDFELYFINCDHGTGAPDAVGVIICVDGKKILEVGDTSLRLDRIQEYKSLGNIDLLIAPINGAFGNLNAKECSTLASAIQPKCTIPCHYGMFATHGGNLEEFRQEMTKQTLTYKFLRLGESIKID